MSLSYLINNLLSIMIAYTMPSVNTLKNSMEKLAFSFSFLASRNKNLLSI